MGMYTEVWFRAEIKPKHWSAVDLAIEASEAWSNEPPHDHPFFKTARWPMVFRGRSYYFPQPGFFRWDQPVDHYGRDMRELAFQSSLKNYDFEIEAFFDWITPLTAAEPGGFLGYSLYEESNTPVLYHVKGEW